MTNLVLTVSFLVVMAVVAFGQESARVERALPNLCSGPPGDPLPPVRPNRPPAAEMAAKRRQHPYLFFDAESRQALRDRAKDEPWRALAERLRTHAEECLKREMPPLPKVFEGIRPYLPDGSYNPEYLRHNYDDFYHQAYVVKEVVPTLAFAYQLTADPRFGQAGKEWLLGFASRSKLARKEREADFDAANVAFGLALGYDWLWELLSESERQVVQDALTRLAKPIVAAGKRFLESKQPDLSRGNLGNNHQTRTHGLFGLTPLVLLYELPEAAEWLDVEIQAHRDRLYPSAWAPNGEHLDAWDHFESSLDDPIPFVVALKRLG
ncbi:MAG: DUF4962 domain-containing protein, partial [Planctomycetes bacterium]|nr:DUF4962 domain-containing protein [Planctomycetota bacterium]